ncbi:CHAP domain-containing protein [Sphaerisporangium sp. TRM90804]|uniref:CHAP domain-containing protein n=1 Tax=Sphaerisporangium sp. TRM90804 TaxID=3031113 RepID=UPI0024493CC6|nr:CHAP domain-containing protein [Sphaerisporangium sp. TRM90804]MDH2429558.1 CHAP domain-containing protein [Sphaerisporangium sp. TRM90804]
MFLHRLLDAPKNHLKAGVVGGLILAQVATGATMAYASDLPRDPITAAAAAEAPATTARQVSANEVLRLAESQVGVSENAYGGGTKFHQWYMSTERAHETVARDGGSIAGFANAPWCDMFVSWVGHQLGIEDTMGADAYTVAHAKWFASQNRWGAVPKPGAVVFFDWSGAKSVDGIDHVGFVVQDNGDGTIKTVEGNTGNGKVEVRERPTYQVTGYGYPAYAA